MRYITVKLTEDQHRKLTWVVNDWLFDAEYSLKHSRNQNTEFLIKEIAFSKRLKETLAQAKS